MLLQEIDLILVLVTILTAVLMIFLTPSRQVSCCLFQISHLQNNLKIYHDGYSCTYKYIIKYLYDKS